MEESLNFASLAHGKIVEFWNGQFWLTTWVNNVCVFYIYIIYWYIIHQMK